MSLRDIEFGEDFLEDIKEWIVDKYEFYELYNKKQILDWVVSNYPLGDVYDVDEIEDWLLNNAEDYGYVKEE